MTYFLGRDVAVGLSTEQSNYGIKFASGAITISNTSSTSGDLGGAYGDPDFVPRRAGVSEKTTITAVSNTIADYESLESNNKYILLYSETGKKYLIWFDHDTTGEKPLGLNEDFEQEINIASESSAEQIASQIRGQTGSDSDFAAAFNITGSGITAIFENKDSGAAVDTVRGSGYDDNDLTVTVTTEGAGLDVDLNLTQNDELRIDDVVGVDFNLGAVDEDIAYMGQRTALKAEIKKEVTITITKKKSNNAFSLLFNEARCGIRATDGSTNFGGGSNNVEFDNNLNQPFADANGSGFGFRVYLELKAGSEVLTLPNCCITEYNVTLNPDAVQEETITFYSNVTPVIGTAVNVTTTASTAF